MALVVFLRGCNVGGHRTFRPTLLARHLKHMDAVSIGAAGTFVIRQPASRAKVCAELTRRLPFEAGIIICHGREILRLTSLGPFTRQRVRPDIVRFVSVLSRRPRSRPALPASLPPRGQWLVRILGREGRSVTRTFEPR